ncbi:MAG: magnesium and cobalt transport protein CorA [Desulfuromonas sp.]|nr:MAG: magnesium and cobalt transport protein CorA [Desulfuromonas sp.]
MSLLEESKQGVQSLLKESTRSVQSLLRIRAKEVGLPPGTLVHVGGRKMEQPVLSFFDYDPVHLDIQENVSFESCLQLKESSTVSWINLDGIHDIPLIEKFGSEFGIHPLALEDILNTEHRPKIEDFEDFSLIILKMLQFNETSGEIETEQVSLLLSKRYVLSFQERPGDVFDGLRDRLQRSNGRIRQRGTDYLAYALLDSIVDSYFHILEKVGDRLALLEEQVSVRPDQECMQQIHRYKSELIKLRKSIWPLRDVISELQRGESGLIAESTSLYLRDLYDHTIQVLDTVEIFRDTVSGLLDLYLSSISQRMNEVMQVLTIMATIFIPLTFIAGIYGMNFEYMPELKWRWGYPAVWGLMGGCLLGMLIYFKRKKWF